MSHSTKLHSVSPAKKTMRQLPRQTEAVRERSTKALAKNLSVFLDEIDDKLFDLADGAVEDERNKLLDAMRELRIKRSGIETGFKQSLMEAFQALVRNKKSEESKDDEPSLDSLTLVNDDELEVEVAIDNMARRVRTGFVEQLDAFNHRLEYLFEGRLDITERNGPLEPRQIGNAFQSCIETLELDIRTRLVLFKLFEREVLTKIESVVADANQQLIDSGVLPEMKAVPVKQKAPKRSSSSGSSSAGPSAGTGGNTEEASSQMFGMLQEMLSAMRSMAVGAASGSAQGNNAGGGGNAAALSQPDNMAVMQNGVAYVGGAPVQAGSEVHAVSSDDLLGVLNRLQRVERSIEEDAAEEPAREDVKEELSTLLDEENAGSVHALEQGDDDVINLISMLFDFILDDHDLPDAIKALIGRLQIPLLKLAITDKDFFTNDEHPARKLLNTLARVGSQWTPSQGDDDPLYQLVEESVHRVLDDYDLDSALFNELLEDVNGFVEQQTQRAERVETRVREVEEGRAQAEQANLEVGRALDKRLAGRHLPPIAARILQDAWRQVLYLTFLREGPGSEAWAKRLKVADAVVWSLLPHKDEASQERLKALSPRLATSLDQGLMAINFDTTERQTLITGLRQAHAQLLQGQATEREKVQAETKPERQPETSLPPDSPLIGEVAAITNGQWVELGSGDDASRCKLAANIRQGTKLIFINRRGVKAAEFSAVELAEKIHQGDAKLLEEGALFDRALESVIGDLRKHMRPA